MAFLDGSPLVGRELIVRLERDEYDAMDTSNVMKGRTRHAKPQYTYQEEPQSHYQTMVDR